MQFQVRSTAASASAFGPLWLRSRGVDGYGARGTSKFSLAFVKTLEQAKSPARKLAHLPHCTHLCRPETRDGLSTSRPRRPGTAGCRAALGSGESLKLSFEGKRVPARRARSPELGSRGSKLWQLRSHAEHEGRGSGWQTDRTVAARGRALETRSEARREEAAPPRRPRAPSDGERARRRRGVAHRLRGREKARRSANAHRRHPRRSLIADRQTDRRREPTKQKCRRAK